MIKKITPPIGLRPFCSPLLLTFFLILIASCKKDDVKNNPVISDAGATFNVRATKTKTTTKSIYTVVSPISLTGVSNETISDDSINCNKTSTMGITLNNCHNIHITKVKIYNSTSDGIYLINCSNITIDTCYITNVASGVNAVRSTFIIVNYNQMKNMLGPLPSGQFVQFNNVSGAGSCITNNKLEDITGASNAEDAISLYETSGTAASPIMISGNWIRGGGPSKTGSGINLGDDGGNYLIAENNILVNPGQVGITISSGTNNQIVNNTIYSAKGAFSNVGVEVWNQYTSLSGCSMITISGNQVNWTNVNGISNGSWNGNNCGTVTGWSTNNWAATTVTAAILPTVIITTQ